MPVWNRPRCVPSTRADRPGRKMHAGDDLAHHGRAGRLSRCWHPAVAPGLSQLLTLILVRAMTDQDGSGPTLVHLTAEQARDTVAAAAQQYFESRRGRVDAFVDRHFSVAGALALHRKALG